MLLCCQNQMLQAIFYETFQSKHLTKLAHSSTNQNVQKKGKTKDKDTPEVAGLDKLLRCFKVYGQAICRYAQSTATATVTTQLQIAVSEYRTRLSDCLNCQNVPTSVVVLID